MSDEKENFNLIYLSMCAKDLSNVDIEHFFSKNFPIRPEHQAAIDEMTRVRTEFSPANLNRVIREHQSSFLDKKVFEQFSMGLAETAETIERTPVKKPRIYRPPGHKLSNFLQFALTAKSFNQLVAQTILDEREEHAEALQNGRIWQARWIPIRLWCIVGFTLVGSACASAVSKLFPRTPSL